jgi:hypothetical protein
LNEKVLFQTYGLISKNPVLKNITDYLVEEGSYEEEELLGQCIDDKSNEESEEFMLERDEQLLRVRIEHVESIS